MKKTLNGIGLARGFSIMELMIALTIGMLILAGVTSVFVNSSNARTEVERNSRQIENGRYALSLLSDDLRMAGYMSSFDPYQLVIFPVSPPLAGVTAMPSPCDNALASTTFGDTPAGGPAGWSNTYFFHIQGFDSTATSNASTIPVCLSDVRTTTSGNAPHVPTDILVVRRISSCVGGPTAGSGCDAATATLVTGAPFFQSSNCYQNGELATNTGSTTDYEAHFALNTDLSTLTKHALDCTSIAPYRRYIVHIYYVANNDLPGDGVPTLKRAELVGSNASGTNGWTIVPLVEGIETIQFEYGMDTDSDGLVDTFNADPGSYSSCAGAACVNNWLNTYAIKVNVLARNTEKSTGYVDGKTYVLGKKKDGVTDNAFGPFNDAYKRHAFTSAVRLDNPAGRRTP